MEKFDLSPLDMGKNEIYNNYCILSQYVLDNFDALYSGALKLSKEHEEIRAISDDCYAPRRIQFGKTRLHNSQGLKIADGWHYTYDREYLTDDNLLVVVDQIRKLGDAAAEDIKTTLQITVISN